MHERSLVKSLLEQVEAIRVEQQGTSIEEIRIEIGPLAGAEPLLVQSAFSELAALDAMNGARLVVEVIPLCARCGKCGIVEVALTRIACPNCGARDVRIVSGDEVRLKSVTIRQPEKMEIVR